MKKLSLVFSTLLISLSLLASGPGIDEKLVSTFKSSFPTAEQVSWYELPKAYVVNFVENGMRARVIYQKDGNTTEFTRYYFESNLPFLIQSKIKKAYPNKTIFGVVEVTVLAENGQSKIDYHVKLEDENTWTTVKSDVDGNLTVTEKYRKAPQGK
jgi:hypothetical protein